MNKKEILTQLRQAKSAHIQWRSYAQALTAGIAVDEGHVPVIHTDCKFGRWYYGAGQNLSSLSGYSAIDTPHEMLHKIYMRIFKLLFGDDDRGALQRLFKSSAKLKREHQEEAEVLMEKLLAVSGTLLEAIGQLEKEVMQMTEEDIAAIY